MANVRVPPFSEAPSTVVGGTATSVFPFDFPFWSSADINVYIDDELVDRADYTVKGFAIQDEIAVEGGYGSGEVTLDTSVTNVTVTIDRLVVGDRQTQFSRSIPLGMPALNGDLNRLTARQQDLERQKVTRPVGDPIGRFVTWDADGRPVFSSGTGSDPALRTDLAALPGSGLIGFDPGITGATGWTVQAAIRALPVMPAAVGSLATTTLTTATLLKAFDYAIANKRPIELTGVYNVNGPVTSATTRPDCALDLRYERNAVINVDAASTHIEYLIGAFSDAAAVHMVGQTGGTLTINCNNKVARGLTLLSDDGGSTIAGECHVRGLRINDVHTIVATGGGAYALTVEGPYAAYSFDDIIIDGVSRHADLDLTGDCKGMRIAQCRSPVLVTNSAFRRVLGGTQDADGAYVTGPLVSSLPSVPLVRFVDCEFEDCQGRSLKTQARHTESIRNTFIRQNVVTIAQGHEVDAQMGSAHIEGWDLRYRLNGATSPLGATFIAFMIQAIYNDAPKRSYIGPGKVSTEVAIPNLLYVKIGVNSPVHEVDVDGAVVQALSALSTTAFTRAMIEFSAAEIKAASRKMTLRVRNTSAPNTQPLIAYTGGDGTDISAKLEVLAEGNHTTLTATGTTSAFYALSGNVLTNLAPLTLGVNKGYFQVFETRVLDWNTIPPGNDYDVNLANFTQSNGPAVGSTGYARITTGHGEGTWYARLFRQISWADGARVQRKVENGWVLMSGPGKPGATTVGDAAATLTAITSTINQVWSTTLTADRAVTLSTTGAMVGDIFRISRPAAGAFNLNVGTGPLKALAAGTWCEVTYDGSAWVLTSYGTL